MRVLVVGAYGLIGGYVTARLLADGHDVVGAGREIERARRRFPQAEWVGVDLSRASMQEWLPHLADVDAVVNCAGALQDSPRDDLAAVHTRGVGALVSACEATGVRRFIQISAAGVASGEDAFRATKRAGDAQVSGSGLEWVILRPGLVLAPAAYGGSALLRGLAAFPLFIPALSADTVVQVVSVDDVAEAVARSVAPGARAGVVCDLVSDEATSLRDILLALRGWLGLGAAPVIQVPRLIGRLSARAADALAWLGWRSPMRTTALDQLASGVRGAPDDGPRLLGFRMSGLEVMLSRWPSGVQERWFARLYFAKPLALAVLALFWMASGVIGLARFPQAVGLLTSGGMADTTAGIMVAGGSLADLVLAALVCHRRTAPAALMGMVAVTAAYLAGATILTPDLWLDPLGPLVKSLPAAVLAILALAMLEER